MKLNIMECCGDWHLEWSNRDTTPKYSVTGIIHPLGRYKSKDDADRDMAYFERHPEKIHDAIRDYDKSRRKIDWSTGASGCSAYSQELHSQKVWRSMV